MELAGRRVLITGASRGIGEALADEFARAGALLALVGRDSVALGDLARRLGGSSYVADLADPGQLQGLIARIESDGGPVDVLVNNAGVDTTGDFVGQEASAVETLYRTNLLAPVELCRQILPGMVARSSGHIVNVSSFAGVSMFPGLAAYGSSKAGLSHFTAGLRADLRGRAVGTTLVELGPVATDLLTRAKDYPPTGDSFGRAEEFRLLRDLDPGAVATEIVTAVRLARRHVRLPKRAAVAAALVEAPRRATEWLLTGIAHQPRSLGVDRQHQP